MRIKKRYAAPPLCLLFVLCLARSAAAEPFETVRNNGLVTQKVDYARGARVSRRAWDVFLVSAP